MSALTASHVQSATQGMVFRMRVRFPASVL